MRSTECFSSAVAAVIAVVLLVAFTLLGPDWAGAQEAPSPSGPKVQSPPQACSCPKNDDEDWKAPWRRPKVADARPEQPKVFDTIDELAALEAVHLALTEVGDGQSYIWHRRSGILSGVVRPTASFRNAAGRICRHIEVTLTAGARSKRTEGIACRDKDGAWSLEG